LPTGSSAPGGNAMSIGPEAASGSGREAGPSVDARDRAATSGTMIARSLARPYRVTPSMVLLASLVPLYVLIPAFFPPRARQVPELALDRALPLAPSWVLVYGALYLFLILLPILVVRHEELIQRTVYAYLSIWITAYLFFFVLYPTVAPRPPLVVGEGFAAWGLSVLYSADPPYNCFPSLHVAHSYVSALALYRVHRKLGILSTICATLVAISTLFTKQHYVLDVLAGAAMAFIAYGILLRTYASNRVPEFDRRVAPRIALCLAVVAAVGLLAFWLLYLWRGETHFEFGP